MNAVRINRPSSRWFWIVSIWFGVGLFNAIQNVAVVRAQGVHISWMRAAMSLLFAWVPWALATPLVLHLGRQYPLVRLSACLRHIAAYLSIAFVAAAWSACLDELLNPWVPLSFPGPFVPLFSKSSTCSFSRS